MRREDEKDETTLSTDGELFSFVLSEPVVRSTDVRIRGIYSLTKERKKE